MAERTNIQAFLKANGIPPTAKDEEIREVLLSARWDKDEVDAALIVLKENIVNNDTHVDTLHKVFNSSNKLSSAEISSLLGIDITLTENDVNSFTKNKEKSQKLLTISIFVLSFVIAISGLIYLMYKEQAGFFHVAQASLIKNK